MLLYSLESKAALFFYFSSAYLICRVHPMSPMSNRFSIKMIKWETTMTEAISNDDIIQKNETFECNKY